VRYSIQDTPEMEEFRRSIEDAIDENSAAAVRPFGSITSIYNEDCLAFFNTITRVDPSYGAISVQLPEASSGDFGKIVLVKNVGSSTNGFIVVAANNGTIDGSPSDGSATAYGYMSLVAVGENTWSVIGEA
jgi:hypothetical protein